MMMNKLKFMKLIKELLFGKRTEPVAQFSTGVRTVNEIRKPSENKWYREFKVSSQYMEPIETNTDYEFDVTRFKKKLFRGE